MRPRLHGGAVGTELVRRGFAIGEPQWSAAANLAAPELVAEIHRDYAAAGAELVTANTTCVHRHDVGDATAEHCAIAIALARRAGVRVAASLAMLPASIDADARTAEYRRVCDAMRDADVLLMEGFVDAAELLRAIAATRMWPGPRWAALAGPGVMGLGGVIAPALAAGIALVAVHCCSIADADAALTAARAIAHDAPLGAYPSPDAGEDDAGFAQRLVARARAHRLTWVGSCCGSTPTTTAAIATALSA